MSAVANSPWAWLPNAVTYSRVGVAIGLIAGAIYLSFTSPNAAPVWFGLTAFVAYVLGALTDFIDGALARALNVQSEAGARLDPMADKALAFGALCFVAAANGFSWLIVLAGVVIVLRDFWIDRLRARQPKAAGLKVSPLAKIKTALLFVSLGFLFTGLQPWPDIFGRISNGAWTYAVGGFLPGVTLLWIAAFLAVLTGWRYVRAFRVTSGGA
jgi:cardiolipin synthase